MINLSKEDDFRGTKPRCSILTISEAELEDFTGQELEWLLKNCPNRLVRVAADDEIFWREVRDTT